MKVRGVFALVVCLLIAGAGAARVAAAKQGITVTVAALGCSTSAGANSFDARSWSWGATNVTDPVGGGGSGSGKAVISALTLTRTTDACSPALLGGVVTGKHFQSLSLTQSDDKGAVTATVLLNDVILTGWEIGGTSESADAIEEVQVSFERFTFTDVASGNKFCWDLAANKGC